MGSFLECAERVKRDGAFLGKSSEVILSSETHRRAPPFIDFVFRCARLGVWRGELCEPEQSGVALRLPPQSKRDRRFLIIFVSFRVFLGQEFLRSTHVPVPDCDLAGAS